MRTILPIQGSRHVENWRLIVEHVNARVGLLPMCWGPYARLSVIADQTYRRVVAAFDLMQPRQDTTMLVMSRPRALRARLYDLQRFG